MKILDAKWFNTVGIVQVRDPYEGIKYYIGVDPGWGATELEGRQHIASWGNKFPKDAGDALFGVKE